MQVQIRYLCGHSSGGEFIKCPQHMRNEDERCAGKSILHVDGKISSHKCRACLRSGWFGLGNPGVFYPYKNLFGDNLDVCAFFIFLRCRVQWDLMRRRGFRWMWSHTPQGMEAFKQNQMHSNKFKHGICRLGPLFYQIKCVLQYDLGRMSLKRLKWQRRDHRHSVEWHLPVTRSSKPSCGSELGNTAYSNI